MQQQKLYITALILSVFLFIGFSDGPAGGIGNNGVRKQDRTGSPHAISSGKTCSTCHNDGAFTPSLNIDLLDNGSAVSTYEPGKTYQLKYTLGSANATPLAYGIQSVVLKNNGNTNSGLFGTAPAGTQVAPIDSRSYFEHSTASSSSTFEIDWTAPDAGTGEVTVYASGIVSNLDNDNDNDNGIAETLTLNELSTAINSRLLNVKASLFPNPTSKHLNLAFSAAEKQLATLSLINASGKKVLQETILINQGESIHYLDIENISNGLYWVQLFNKEKGTTLLRKFIKH